MLDQPERRAARLQNTVGRHDKGPPSQHGASIAQELNASYCGDGLKTCDGVGVDEGATVTRLGEK